MRNLIFDEVGILTADEKNQLVQTIYSLQKDTNGSEICIKIISSNNGKDPHSEGVKQYNSIGIGQAGVNNGVLVVFAMDDRHVELIPGIRYNSLFNKRTSESLLKEHVVPLMRAGKKGKAVIEGTIAIAKRIRQFEIKGFVKNDDETKGQRLSLREKIILWFFGVLISLAILCNIGSFILDHLCPNCNRFWMSVHETVLKAPTTTSSGTGERVVDCTKCKYHSVSQYSISLIDYDNSSSSSSSSGGGSSDGGGGGGADW